MDGASKVVASYLKNKSPKLRALGGKPVHAQLVFSNYEARLQRIEKEIEHQVSTISSVVDDLLRRDADGRHDLSACRERICNVLSNAPLRDAVPRTILSYTIGEQLSTSSSSRSYEATHDDGTEFVVRLLRPKNTLDRAYATRERDGLLREYEVLKRLSSLDVCPPVHSYQELDEGEFLIPIQAIEGRTLSQEIMDGVQPDGARVHDVVAAAYRALAIVHEADPPVVHRSITPDRIVVTPNGSVRFTDFQIAHIDEKTGLTTVLADIDPDAADQHYWRAPEARNDLTYATTASDVWALATSLKAWVIGSTLSRDLKKDTLPGETRARLDSLAQPFTDFLKAARADTGRQSAREIADLWGPTEPVTTATDQSPTVEEPELPLFRQDLSPGDLIAERYELVTAYDPGSTAVTYLVRDVEIDEAVVLKCFDFDRVPESLALGEFKKAKDLVHERIATVREYHRPEHPFHLVIDHAAGHEALGQTDRFLGDTEAVAGLAQSLLEGLAYIHDKGYLHRDISPRNIIVNDDDPTDLKIIDFGLSALKSGSNQRSMGTYGYVAPEIIRGAEWSPAADVYSTGVVLYQLLTGDWPFAWSGAPVHEELRDPPEALGEGATSLGRLLLTAVQPDPAARFPDAGEFLAGLHEHLEGASAEMPPAEEAGQHDSGSEHSAETDPSSSWLEGFSSLSDADTDTIEDESPEDSARPPLFVVDSPPIPSLEGTHQPPLSADPLEGESTLRVVWVPAAPTRPSGNSTFGIGRIRKYSLGLDGTVRGVVASSGRERTVYARVPAEFMAMVNAAKRAGGQSEGGSLVIDHEGHVLVGTAEGVLLAGRLEGYLTFEDGSQVITPVPPSHLSPGDPWEGLGVGLRYKLNASASDIAYESTRGGWVWLSDEIGEAEAERIATMMGHVKRGGGRFYVNEAGAAFGPMQMGGDWQEAYLGRISPTSWFSSSRD